MAAGDASGDAIAPDARPRLPRGVRIVHNEAQGGWVLLAQSFNAPRERIHADVSKLLLGLADKKLLEL